MKTQIIHLDKFDDIISARDRVSWSKSPRIIIVFPEKKKLRFSLMELVLLYRQANRQGAVAAVVVKNSRIQAHLEQSGLTCFGTLAEANQSRWPVGRRMKPLEHDLLKKQQPLLRKTLQTQRSKPRLGMADGWRVFFYILGCMSLITILAFFIPKAHIVIDTGQMEQQYSLELHGSIGRETTAYSSVIKLNPLQVTVEGNVQVDTTGFTPVNNEQANGFVIVTNLSVLELDIPAGLVVQTDTSSPVRFETTQIASLSAGIDETVAVPVQAMVPGVTGNVPAGVITVVEGEIGLSISVNNPEPLLGGTSTHVSSPTHSDYTIARAELLEKLNTAAIEKLKAALGVGQKIVPGSLKMHTNLQETLVPELGMPGEKLDLWMQADYTAWYILDNDVQSNATVLLDALLPAGYSPEPGQIEVDYAEPSLGMAQDLVWPVTISRSIDKEIPIGLLVALVRGHSPQKAAGMIAEKYELKAPPQVQLIPSWWPVMPFFNFQYEIVK